jgi:sec-independent protein translocase protein TatA
VPLGLGIPELVIILVILLVIFGPKRLPGLGRSLGTGMREFKDSVTGDSKHDEDEDEDDDRPALAAAPTPPASTQPQTEPAREDAPVSSEPRS